MTEKIIIVAYDAHRVIGKNGSLPEWRLPADMKNFKELTVGHIVIMGRKTFESFPEKYRPLPGRINIIISRNEHYVARPIHEDTYVCISYEEAITLAEAFAERQKIFIIGGGEIYLQALTHPEINIDQVIATEVKGSFSGDTFFPKITGYAVKEVSVAPFYKDGKNSHDFVIKTLTLSRTA